MSTEPESPAGEVAVIELSELGVNEVAAVDPKSTAVTLVKPVPVIVTEVPPATGPTEGLTPVIAGADAYVNSSAELPVADVPPGVFTVTLTGPKTVDAGALVVISPSETIVNGVAAFDPNLTTLAPSKPVPVIVTGVPPAIGPTAGLMLVTVGSG
jgi:hypothetical protein